MASKKEFNVEVTQTLCTMCGKSFGDRVNSFNKSRARLYKGVQRLPICKACVDIIYHEYFNMCKDQKRAVRQTCRKLDLYWSDAIYHTADSKASTTSIMDRYIAVTNNPAYINRSYDDTLQEEGLLWNFPMGLDSNGDVVFSTGENTEVKLEDIPKEVRDFWGPHNSPSMLMELEQRRRYWMSRIENAGEVDIGTEALIRQVCSLEIDINRDRSAGKSVDKNVNTLNTLLGSMNLKPVQLKEDADAELENMPLGVGIQKWETQRPLPPTAENMKDVNHRVKDILVWFCGHLCKMAGVKNSYSRLYEEEMDKLRVKRPDIEEDDDAEFQYRFFGGGGG